jgi:hypothetical protein
MSIIVTYSVDQSLYHASAKPHDIGSKHPLKMIIYKIAYA